MTQQESTSWGHHSRNYAEASSGNFPSKQWPADTDSAFEQRWAERLTSISPGIKEAVERACKQWNGPVREHIRVETALRLTGGEEAQAVPVRVADGMPSRFAKELGAFEDIAWLILNRGHVEAAELGAGFLAARRDLAERLLAGERPPAQVREIESVRDTAARLRAKLDEARALEKLLGTDEDVLGAYFFRKPEIVLYWVPIGIISSLLAVRSEALTIVVLAHELAHAYTHRGRDIDGESWDTEAFADASLSIVEGLAQFYAKRACDLLEPRFPDALRAYNALLEKQRGPYRAHLEWLGDEERGGEIVRVAMLECRSRKLADVALFTQAIDRHRAQVKGRNRRFPQASAGAPEQEAT